MSEPVEPDALLDAVAAAPDDEGAWSVLADWLGEHGSRFALLAATSSDTPRSDRASALQSERARLPVVEGGSEPFLSAVVWYRGYVLSAAVELYRPLSLFAPAPVFSAPQLKLMHRLTLRRRSTESPRVVSGALEAVTATPPPRLKTLAVTSGPEWQAQGDVAAQLEPLTRARPLPATTLELLGWTFDEGERSVALLDAIASRGWRCIRLPLAMLPVSVARSHPEVRFEACPLSAELPGGLNGLPNVSLLPAGTRALWVDEATGRAAALGTSERSQPDWLRQGLRAVRLSLRRIDERWWLEPMHWLPEEAPIVNGAPQLQRVLLAPYQRLLIQRLLGQRSRAATKRSSSGPMRRCRPRFGRATSKGASSPTRGAPGHKPSRAGERRGYLNAPPNAERKSS